MALILETLNLGTYPNDGTGDDLRTAFEKVKSNFDQLAIRTTTGAVNLGSGSGTIFVSELDGNLRFRSFNSANNNLVISQNSSEILLDVKDSINSVVEDTAPRLGGTLDLNTYGLTGDGSITITGLISAPNIAGNLTGTVSSIANHTLSDLGNVGSTAPSEGQLLRWNGAQWEPHTLPVVTKIVGGANVTVDPPTGIGEVTISAASSSVYSADFDFGGIANANNLIELLLQATPVDFGSAVTPSSFSLDLGVIADSLTKVYVLSSPQTTAVEGGTLTINLDTLNVLDGRTVPYSITGVSSEDISGAPLTGEFVVVNNTGILQLVLSQDIPEELETITVTIDPPTYGAVPSVYSVSVLILDSVLSGGTDITDDTALVVDGGTPLTTVVDAVLDGGTV